MIIKKNIVFVCSDKCQNKCLYCLNHEPDKDKLFQSIILTDTKLIMKYIRIFSKYTNEMCLTGFEPTLNRDIFKIIDYAVNNGIDYISFHTNGVLLNASYLAKLLPYNKYLKIFISLPSATESVYNRITKSKNLPKVYSALALLLKLNFLFFVNIVVSKLNIKDLGKTIAKLDRLGIKRVIFIYIDSLNKNYNVRFSESIPILEEILKNHDQMKFQAFDIPPCLLRKFPVLKTRRLAKCATNNEFNIGKHGCVTKEQYSPIMCKQKINLCNKCGYLARKQCNGVIKAYLKIFGDSEFKKLTAADIK
ncbi:MAG: radical SAM protein [Candidatus Parcubacteria bacterium]|nr:radical SAM protein [Candidatus Parcubacteria bacterium]